MQILQKPVKLPSQIAYRFRKFPRLSQENLLLERNIWPDLVELNDSFAVGTDLKSSYHKVSFR